MSETKLPQIRRYTEVHHFDNKQVQAVDLKRSRALSIGGGVRCQSAV